MQRILILGAGKIGSLIAFLLAHSNDYQVYLADLFISDRPDLDRITPDTPNLTIHSLDATQPIVIKDFIQQHNIDAIVPCLSYYFNVPLAKIARECGLHYFDLTEDVSTTEGVLEYAKGANTAFVPQCGLAPGFISIVANDLMQHFTTLDTVKMRVGALPTNISNALEYSLTWSTDGLINEYGNLCHAIEHGKEIDILPLEGLEEIKIDGLTYEAFNTSGGIGSLGTTYADKVNSLSYKTMRYPGHCAKVQFLMNDLKLNDDRETLKRILENAIPKTYQDVVLVYVSVTGQQDNLFIEENYVKKFYPKKIHGLQWSAIQLTTASSLCAVLDIVMKAPDHFAGLILQESFSLNALTANRFGHYFL